MSIPPFQPSHVIKRDSRVLAFDVSKISSAIARAVTDDTEILAAVQELSSSVF